MKSPTIAYVNDDDEIQIEISKINDLYFIIISDEQEKFRSASVVIPCKVLKSILKIIDTTEV